MYSINHICTRMLGFGLEVGGFANEVLYLVSFNLGGIVEWEMSLFKGFLRDCIKTCSLILLHVGGNTIK